MRRAAARAQSSGSRVWRIAQQEIDRHWRARFEHVSMNQRHQLVAVEDSARSASRSNSRFGALSSLNQRSRTRACSERASCLRLKISGSHKVILASGANPQRVADRPRCIFLLPAGGQQSHPRRPFRDSTRSFDLGIIDLDRGGNPTVAAGNFMPSGLSRRFSDDVAALAFQCCWLPPPDADSLWFCPKLIVAIIKFQSRNANWITHSVCASREQLELRPPRRTPDSARGVI